MFSEAFALKASLMKEINRKIIPIKSGYEARALRTFMERSVKTFIATKAVRAIALPHNAETPSGSREQEHHKRLLLHARYSSAISSPGTAPFG